MSGRTYVGQIARLQVQRRPLKASGRYVPDALLSVESALLAAPGMLGAYRGGWIVDAHHGAHPASRGGGRRALSVGFTSHYRRMGTRFGTRVVPGVAGENLIVDTDRAFAVEELGAGLVIVAPGGEETVLTGLRVAAPCVEFTSYLLGRDDVAPREEIERELTFLHGGTRGFVCSLQNLEAEAATVELGYDVFLGGD